MKNYKYLAGYKRQSRVNRDDLKDLLSINNDSKSGYKARFSNEYCKWCPTDPRGRRKYPKNIRVKMIRKARKLMD